MRSSAVAPFYLATNRGFYKGAADALAADFHTGMVLFTSNIRRATAFSSFEDAETCFSLLIANSTSDMNTVHSYHAVLCCPVVAISPTFDSLPDVYAEVQLTTTSLEQLLHDANCCCEECE